EIAEVQQVEITQDKSAIKDEVGDLLFSVVNLARHHGIDAEQALSAASDKFDRRFRGVEQLVDADQARLSDLAIDQLEDYWQEAKRQLG
ncbi:MAG: MazG nucleotide pyrophosphohydrolase domain-containing protein, partial [Kangiellaceae bacterium]|nr:MazG nucleotide pyrophosphohydrolase domain-containing protein [Kangiellaceae bacterium]